MKNLKKKYDFGTGFITFLLILALVVLAGTLMSCSENENIVGGNDKPIEIDTVGSFYIIMEYGGCDSVHCWGESFIIFNDYIYNEQTDSTFHTLESHIPLQDSLIACSRIYIEYDVSETSYIELLKDIYLLNGNKQCDILLDYESGYQIVYGKLN